MSGPTIWVIEDEKFQIDFLRRLFASMYDSLEFRSFGNAKDAKDFAASATVPADLIVVDLAIPDSGAYGVPLPGLEFAKECRIAGMSTPILLRTGFGENVVPSTLLDGRTQLAPKGDSPDQFVRMATSFLALAGYQTRSAPSYLTPEHPVSGGGWIDVGWVLGAIPVATSLWVASALQVTSTRGHIFNTAMIVGGIVGGLFVVWSRLTGNRRGLAVALLCCGGIIVVACGLVIPPIGSSRADWLSSLP